MFDVLQTQVGFGKGTSSKQLWIDGIDSGTSRQQLERQMNKYGKVNTLLISASLCF